VAGELRLFALVPEHCPISTGFPPCANWPPWRNTFDPALEERLAGQTAPEEQAWLEALLPLLREASCRADARIATLERLAHLANRLAQVEYAFLFDKASRLLAIGYNVTDHRRDASYYDLLASEARLASFVGIAQGALPQETWFALGRLLTTTGCGPVLLSWSGSMFEYLMPLLVMPSYDDTLLDQTCKAAVASQIDYGRKSGVPWGVSESGYNAIDAQLNYQYRAFGVPGLGLKRGLAEDLVIAPYATAMALMVEPEKACLNLERMATEGFAGTFGFYEAIDYTPSRLPRGPGKRGGPLLHGPPSGHEPALFRLPAAGPADAATVCHGTLVSGHHAVAAGTDSQGCRLFYPRHRTCRIAGSLQ
jgi:cyclic beta-1,2-glucan synthetase